MKSSATRSSCPEDTPGRTCRAPRGSLSATIRPAAALVSLSRGGLTRTNAPLWPCLPQPAAYELRLPGGARKAAHHRARPGLRFSQLFLDRVEDVRVGDELAVVHDLRGFAAERGRRLPRRPQQVARRDLGKTEPLGEDLSLGALARARRA